MRRGDWLLEGPLCGPGQPVSRPLLAQGLPPRPRRHPTGARIRLPKSNWNEYLHIKEAQRMSSLMITCRSSDSSCWRGEPRSCPSTSSTAPRARPTSRRWRPSTTPRSTPRKSWRSKRRCNRDGIQTSLFGSYGFGKRRMISRWDFPYQKICNRYLKKIFQRTLFEQIFNTAQSVWNGGSPSVFGRDHTYLTVLDK